MCRCTTPETHTRGHCADGCHNVESLKSFYKSEILKSLQLNTLLNSPWLQSESDLNSEETDNENNLGLGLPRMTLIGAGCRTEGK